MKSSGDQGGCQNSSYALFFNCFITCSNIFKFLKEKNELFVFLNLRSGVPFFRGGFLPAGCLHHSTVTVNPGCKLAAVHRFILAVETHFSGRCRCSSVVERWPLYRGWNLSKCMNHTQKEKKLSIVARWPLEEVRLYVIKCPQPRTKTEYRGKEVTRFSQMRQIAIFLIFTFKHRTNVFKHFDPQWIKRQCCLSIPSETLHLFKSPYPSHISSNFLLLCHQLTNSNSAPRGMPMSLFDWHITR